MKDTVDQAYGAVPRAPADTIGDASLTCAVVMCLGWHLTTKDR